MPTTKTLIDLVLYNQAVRILLVIPLLLLVADVVTGVAAAIRHGAFSTSRLADFAGNDLLKWVGIVIPFFTAILMGTPETAATVTASTALGVLAITQIASVTTNIAEIFGQEYPYFEGMLKAFFTALFGRLTGANATPAPVETPAVTGNTVQFSANTGMSTATNTSTTSPSTSDAPAA